MSRSILLNASSIMGRLSLPDSVWGESGPSLTQRPPPGGPRVQGERKRSLAAPPLKTRIVLLTSLMSPVAAGMGMSQGEEPGEAGTVRVVEVPPWLHCPYAPHSSGPRVVGGPSFICTPHQSTTVSTGALSLKEQICRHPIVWSLLILWLLCDFFTEATLTHDVTLVPGGSPVCSFQF